MQPLLDALSLAGYHYLQTPCNSDYPTNPTCNYPMYPDKSVGPRKGPPNPMPPSDCQCGSNWVMENAQKIMCDLDPTVSITTKDAFHDVSDVRPFHLPHIFKPEPGTACSSPTSSCSLETTTVTMPVYDSRDDLDTGLYPVTASEYRTKLKSREACQQSAGVQNVNYTATDKENASICQTINKEAWKWALAHASQKAIDRFNANGQPYNFVEDKWSGIGPTGPKWIHDALTYTVAADKKTVDVQSHYFTTENKNLGNESYLDTVGYHYCKLLSPARAMEWIYVDGLRQFGGL